MTVIRSPGQDPASFLERAWRVTLAFPEPRAALSEPTVIMSDSDLPPEGPTAGSGQTGGGAPAAAGAPAGSGAHSALLQVLLLKHKKGCTGKKGPWRCATPVGVYDANGNITGVRLEMACSTDARPDKLSAANYAGTVNQHAQRCDTCRPVSLLGGG